MTEISDLNDAIAHVREYTGDPDAWRAGLAPTDLAVLLPAAVIDTRELTGLLQKVRANHPQLFDPRTGAPVTPSSAPPASAPPSSAPSPPPAPDGQQGEAAEAIRKAEGDLAQQNSSTSQLDLQVISAILNAHTTAVEGGATLRQLQRDIEISVRSRTDLDAPAGARDFRRFLIGKLREIGAVVETASLDDTSKAALASAWTALYEATKGEATEGQATAGDSPASSNTGSGVDPGAELPPYGADAGTDPLLDQLLADDPRWPTDGPSASGQPQPPPPPSTAPAAASMLPTVPGLSGLGGGLPGGLAAPREDTGPGLGFSTERPIDDPSLDTLLGGIDEPDPATEETPEADPAALEDSVTDATDSEPADSARPDGPTPVRLPNGDTVTAPNRQIANVLKAAIGGTPLGDAFREQGIAIPPAGTAVAHPVDPAHVGSGDIGMFTDRQALALDRSRALLNGQIQPVASVSGPSFLGWQHPPAQGSTTPSASTQATPPNIHTPPPTRPAAAVGAPTIGETDG